MEKNKSIDGLRTRAEKNPESSIDGLKTRSALPVFGTAKHPTLKTVRKARLAPDEIEPVKKPVTKKQSAQKVTRPKLARTTDEDLLAAFSDTATKEAETKDKLEEVSNSFIEPTKSADDIFTEALNETIENDDNESKFVPETAENNTEEPMKKSKKDKKSKKAEEIELTGSLLDEEESKKGKKKPSKARRIITTVILLLVFGIIGLVSWVLLWGNDIIAKITGGRGNIFDAIGAIIGDTYEPLKTDSNKRTNILAFGTSGWDMSGDVGGGIHDGAQLTDSIMVISLNQETGDVAMLSLPRDLKASPTCTATGKVNEVYWCSNMNGDAEEAGANALMKEIGSILGIEFQYFAHINWGSLVSIVDTLGGIRVTLDEDIQDYGGTHAVFDAGVEYTINGEQALGLARARYGTALGDFSRGNSQQKILIGIKDRIYEKNISLSEALGLISTLGDNLRTNLSVNEIKTAIHLTFEFDFNSMRQLPLIDYDKGISYMTFANVNGISYVVPSAGIGNYNAIREYIKVNLNNDPVVREQARIMILNGSERVGVAADERDNLRAEQFNVVGADNAPEGTYPENYAIYFANKAFNGTVQALEKRYNTVAHEAFPDGFDTSSYDILVIIGGDTVETPAEETAE